MIEIYCLSVLERSQKLRCQQGWLPLRVVREGSSPSRSPWLADGLLLLVSLHIVFSLPLSVHVPKFPLFIRKPVMGLGSPL